MFTPGFSHENLEISLRISRVAQHVPTNRAVAETDSSQVFQRVQKLFRGFWIEWGREADEQAITVCVQLDWQRVMLSPKLLPCLRKTVPQGIGARGKLVAARELWATLPAISCQFIPRQ